MTNLERDSRKLLMEHILQKLGVTELNNLFSAVEADGGIEVLLGDCSRKLVSVIITDLDE